MKRSHHIVRPRLSGITPAVGNLCCYTCGRYKATCILQCNLRWRAPEGQTYSYSDNSIWLFICTRCLMQAVRVAKREIFGVYRFEEDFRPLKRKKRFEVLKRCHFTCVYCGRKPPEVQLEVDHIDAVAQGGTNADDNLVAACEDCNAGKREEPL